MGCLSKIVMITLCHFELPAAGQYQDLIQEWFTAVQKENLQAIQAYISKVDINVQDDCGYTALIEIVSHKKSGPKEAIIKLLLQNPDIDINAQNNSGNTALKKAVVIGDTQIVKLLLESRKIDINIKNNRGKNALIAALEHPRENIIQLLLQSPNLDINAQDDYGWTALMISSCNGYTKFVELLLQFGTTFKKFDSVSYSDDTPIALNVNLRNNLAWTALMVAAANNRQDIVKLLLQVSDINLNTQDNTGETALIKAVKEGHENIIKILLELNAGSLDINIQDNNGLTALHVAIEKGDENTVRLLLDNPTIQVNACNRWHNTPYFLAVQQGRYAIARLIKNKIDELTLKAFKITNDIGTLRSVTMQLGPTVLNRVDSDGDTLLHKAFSQNSIEACLLLLQTAQDPRQLLVAKNKNGKYPLDLINPTSPIFLLCLDCAFLPRKRIDLSSQIARLIKSVWVYNSNICAHCAASNCAQRCARCKTVYYCSPKCQKADWKVHKAQCDKYLIEI